MSADTQLAIEDRPVPDGMRIELAISGMSCAACAGRIEKKLNKLDGVTAVVNYATERAVVTGLPRSATDTVVTTVSRAGYTATPIDPDAEIEESNDPRRLASLRRRLLVAAIVTLPLSNLTIALALVPGLRFPGWEWLCIALAVPVVGWAAWPFHRATLRNLRHRTFSMDTLVSVGVLAAFSWAVITAILPGSTGPGYWLGFGVTPAGADALYLEVAAAVTTFLLIGRYFEARARGSATDVLRALRRLGAQTARIRREDGSQVLVPADRLRVGDLVVIHPGETIPADGPVVAGASSVDTSTMTGEAAPRDVTVGDQVVGGTINLTGAIDVRAERVGSATQLEQMATLAEQAQARKARVQKLVDRVVSIFVPAVLIIAVVTFAAWILTGAPVRDAFNAALSVLIIACPCALGLATPTALMVGIGRAGQLGIVIKGPDALEASGRIDTVVLDKTGTVTTGQMTLERMTVVAGRDEGDALRRAAILEGPSEHPVGRALREAWADRDADSGTEPGIELGASAAVTDFVAQPGQGATGVVDGVPTMIGNAALLRTHDIELSDAATALAATAEDGGATCVHLAVDGSWWASFLVSDVIKPSAADGVEQLHRLGLTVVLLTGDTQAAARHIARQIAVDRAVSEVLPADKAAVIADLQAKGHRVAMVGDGINDAAALATADLGIAVVSGTDLALRSADVIVVRRHLGVLADAIAISQRTLRTIRGNLIWAFGYNIAAIPLAASGWLNPLIAGLTMSFSSIFVVTNSLRLRSFQTLSQTPRQASSQARTAPADSARATPTREVHRASHLD